MENKICTICNINRPITKFYRHSSSPDKREYYCKKCKANKYGFGASTRYIRRKKETLEGFLDWLFKSTKRPSTLKGKEFSLTLDYLREIYNNQKGACALSGIAMQVGNTEFKRRNNTKISIDRIDSAKGYIKGNIQLVCSVINAMKLDSSNEEFIALCKKVAEHNKNI